MSDVPLTDTVKEAIRRALAASWSKRTQEPFDPSNPSANQCKQTTIVVHEIFGGKIFKTEVPTVYPDHRIPHFYNRFGGDLCDFTERQFDGNAFPKPIPYDDIPSSLEEAMVGFERDGRLCTMRDAFHNALTLEYPGWQQLAGAGP